jgi:hypothetical protein
MSFPTWPPDINNITDSVFKNTILDGQVDVSGTFYNRTGNVIIGDSSNPDFDPSSNGITLNTTRICLGKDSSVTGDNGVAIGNSATTGLQENSISIGYNSIVDASNSVAIGNGANAFGTESIAIGDNATTSTYTNSVAIGNGTTNTDNNQIKIGTSASAYQMDGRLNLVNTAGGSSSLISYGNAVKMYEYENGLVIGNYEGFYVMVLDTTAEPTSVPSSRAGIEALYINNEGRVWLGNKALTYSVRIRSANIETYISGYTTAGNVSTIGTAGQLVVSSDRRLKENIETYDEPSIDKIMKLKPSYYNWIKGTDKRKELGFIAQDVETIIPEAVDGKKYEYEWKKDEEGEPILDASGNIQFTDEPRYRGLLDRPIIAVLVKAVQEQQEIIETEKAKNTALETQITNILARLDALENP